MWILFKDSIISLHRNIKTTTCEIFVAIRPLRPSNERSWVKAADIFLSNQVRVIWVVYIPTHSSLQRSSTVALSMLSWLHIAPSNHFAAEWSSACRSAAASYYSWSVVPLNSRKFSENSQERNLQYYSAAWLTYQLQNRCCVAVSQVAVWKGKKSCVVEQREKNLWKTSAVVAVAAVAAYQLISRLK